MHERRTFPFKCSMDKTREWKEKKNGSLAVQNWFSNSINWYKLLARLALSNELQFMKCIQIRIHLEFKIYIFIFCSFNEITSKNGCFLKGKRNCVISFLIRIMLNGWNTRKIPSFVNRKHDQIWENKWNEIDECLFYSKKHRSIFQNCSWCEILRNSIRSLLLSLEHYQSERQWNSLLFSKSYLITDFLFHDISFMSKLITHSLFNLFAYYISLDISLFAIKLSILGVMIICNLSACNLKRRSHETIFFCILFLCIENEESHKLNNLFI